MPLTFFTVWEDIPTRGEDIAAGSEAKEANLSLEGGHVSPGRLKLSPRRNRRGFWLGRKTKLLGRLPRSKTSDKGDRTMVSNDPKTTPSRVNGLEGEGVEPKTGTSQDLELTTELPIAATSLSGPKQ